MQVLRIADVTVNGEPILNSGEGCIKRNGVFYVVNNNIEPEKLAGA